MDGLDEHGETFERKFRLGRHGDSRGWESLDQPFFAENAERIVRELNQVLVAEECPKDERSVILLPGIMYLQTHETIGHALELDRILGYELAYAGGSFVTLDDFGRLRYGSEKLTARADATLINSPGSFGFDDDGVPAQNNLLIDRGILVGAITGRQMVEEANASVASFDLPGQRRDQPRYNLLPRPNRTDDQYQYRSWRGWDSGRYHRQDREGHPHGRRPELVDRFESRAIPLRHRDRLAGGGWQTHENGQELHIQR